MRECSIISQKHEDFISSSPLFTNENVLKIIHKVDEKFTLLRKLFVYIYIIIIIMSCC